MPPEMVLESLQVHEQVVRTRLEEMEIFYELALGDGIPDVIARYKKLVEVAERDLALTLSTILVAQGN